MRRTGPALFVTVLGLLGCGAESSIIVEWTLAVDPQWESAERWEDVKDAQLAVLRGRMAHLNDLMASWDAAAQVTSTELLVDGRLVVSVVGPAAESVDLTPLLIQGSVVGFQFVRDDVDLREVEPAVADLLGQYVARTSVPGFDMPIPTKGVGEYAIPVDRTEELDSALTSRRVDRRLGALDLVWGDNVAWGTGNDVGSLYLVEDDPFITSSDIESVIGRDEDGVPTFFVELSSAAGVRVHETTSRRMGNRVALVWGGYVVEPPLNLAEPFGRHLTFPIKTLDEAALVELQMTLLTGPLPAPLMVLDVQVLGAE